jgi:hypothetical protein
MNHERGLSLEEKTVSEQGRALLEKLSLAPWASRLVAENVLAIRWIWRGCAMAQSKEK